MRLRQGLKGSLLIELLAMCVLVALFLPFVVSALVRMQERHLLGQAYQDQQVIKAAIDAHFQAQWARLVPASCRIGDDVSIMIQSGRSPPARLALRDLDDQSDWLSGTDYGLCRGTITVKENPFETRLSCSWKVGDSARFSSCEAIFEAQVFSVSAQKSVLQLKGGDVAHQAIGQSGILENQESFYWYIAQGRDGRKAFWRTPEESGNALELWNGLERLSVFPLLDESANGKVDTLDTRYGRFSLNALRGLWVEYQYQLSHCQFEASQAEQEYFSMRGEIWRYSPPCQGVGNHVIVLQ